MGIMVVLPSWVLVEHKWNREIKLFACHWTGSRGTVSISCQCYHIFIGLSLAIRLQNWSRWWKMQAGLWWEDGTAAWAEAELGPGWYPPHHVDFVYTGPSPSRTEAYGTPPGSRHGLLDKCFDCTKFLLCGWGAARQNGGNLAHL